MGGHDYVMSSDNYDMSGQASKGHRFCMRHQVTWCASLAAIDNSGATHQPWLRENHGQHGLAVRLTSPGCVRTTILESSSIGHTWAQSAPTPAKGC
jgi:hypothetical protein